MKERVAIAIEGKARWEETRVPSGICKRSEVGLEPLSKQKSTRNMKKKLKIRF